MYAYNKPDLSYSTASKVDSLSTHSWWEQKYSLIYSGIY